MGLFKIRATPGLEYESVLLFRSFGQKNTQQ